jgi:hypothetical protein
MGQAGKASRTQTLGDDALHMAVSALRIGRSIERCDKQLRALNRNVPSHDRGDSLRGHIYR